MPCKKKNQKLKSIKGIAESAFELFLQVLNAQGLEISSPWVDNLEEQRHPRDSAARPAQSLDCKQNAVQAAGRLTR
jgi:hypothetical protein